MAMPGMMQQIEADARADPSKTWPAMMARTRRTARPAASSVHDVAVSALIQPQAVGQHWGR